MSLTEISRRSPWRRRAGRRRIVLVDIENAVGGSAALCVRVHWVKRAVEGLLAVSHADHVVIGIGPAGLLKVGTGWTGVRYVTRSGPDGADLALLDVLAEDIAHRFDEVVLVSGDGIFADAVAALASQGVRTTVLAHADCLSRRLELAANLVRFLPEPPSPLPVRAAADKGVA